MEQPTAIPFDYRKFKAEWNQFEIMGIQQYLDDFFLETADWTDATIDMQLDYQAGYPYAALYISGDFYYDEGILMKHFALSEKGTLILVAEEDSSSVPLYFLIYEQKAAKQLLPT